MTSIYQSIQEPSRNETVAVSTTSIVISDAKNLDNPRKVLLVRNISPNSTDTITVTLGNTPSVANAGIVLKQNESFVDTVDSGYTPWQGSVTAICATATGSLAIFER